LTPGSRVIWIVFVAGLAAACSHPPSAERAESRLQLKSTLISPHDVRLDWTGADGRAAGHMVEFATEPEGTYTVLKFAVPSETQFHHPDLAPDTTFYYRVRPFFGPASGVVRVVLPPDPPAGSEGERDDTWAKPHTRAEGSPAATHTIRDAERAGEGAPADLVATVMHSSGIRFTWTDRAQDEDGQLLEIQPEGSPEFSVLGLIDANINSFGLITLPNEKRAAFRVRAFYYGPASNLVHEKTGPESSDNSKN
jgi:hypothetical protein